MARRPHNNGEEQEVRTRFELNREDDRTSHEVDLRKRPSVYEMPDYDNIDFNDSMRNLNLVAPPPRIDPKHGKMHQYWADVTLANGRRLYELLRDGYVVRHPNTVDPAYAAFATEQWQGNDVIMVANRHVLMEIPEYVYRKKQQIKHNLNVSKVNEIQKRHGDVWRDGKVSSDKLRGIPNFKEGPMYSNGSDSELSFSD